MPAYPASIIENRFIDGELRKIKPEYRLIYSGRLNRWQVWDATPIVDSVLEVPGEGSYLFVRDVPYCVMNWEAPVTREYLSADMRLVTIMKLNFLRDRVDWYKAQGDIERAAQFEKQAMIECREHNRRLEDTFEREARTAMEDRVRDDARLWWKAFEE